MLVQLKFVVADTRQTKVTVTAGVCILSLKKYFIS